MTTTSLLESAAMAPPVPLYGPVPTAALPLNLQLVICTPSELVMSRAPPKLTASTPPVKWAFRIAMFRQPEMMAMRLWPLPMME